jgi:hypothetical protein
MLNYRYLVDGRYVRESDMTMKDWDKIGGRERWQKQISDWHKPTKEVSAYETVLQEAQRLVHGGARQQTYGGATTGEEYDRAKLISDGWSLILGVPVEPEQYALCMTWLKIARQVGHDMRDNLVDAAGYLGVVEKIQRDRVEVNRIEYPSEG